MYKFMSVGLFIGSVAFSLTLAQLEWKINKYFFSLNTLFDFLIKKFFN